MDLFFPGQVLVHPEKITVTVTPVGAKISSALARGT